MAPQHTRTTACSLFKDYLHISNKAYVYSILVIILLCVLIIHHRRSSKKGSRRPQTNRQAQYRTMPSPSSTQPSRRYKDMMMMDDDTQPQTQTSPSPHSTPSTPQIVQDLRIPLSLPLPLPTTDYYNCYYLNPISDTTSYMGSTLPLPLLTSGDLAARAAEMANEAAVAARRGIAATSSPSEAEPKPTVIQSPQPEYEYHQHISTSPLPWTPRDLSSSASAPVQRYDHHTPGSGIASGSLRAACRHDETRWFCGNNNNNISSVTNNTATDTNAQVDEEDEKAQRIKDNNGPPPSPRRGEVEVDQNRDCELDALLDQDNTTRTRTRYIWRRRTMVFEGNGNVDGQLHQQP